jgi:micrococcal nuclease
MFKYTAIVDNVVDGDTVDLSIDLGFEIWYKARVRLIGVDTPEKWYNYGKVVAAYAKEKLESQQIEISSTKPDKYGRYLVEIYLKGSDETFNKHLIDIGMAKSYAGAARGNVWRDEELAQTDHELLLNKLDGSLFKQDPLVDR